MSDGTNYSCEDAGIPLPGYAGLPQRKSSFAEPAGSATYRLLNRSDAMCPGDERLLDDCKTWEVIEPNNPHIGQRYDGNLFVPMRRRSQND